MKYKLVEMGKKTYYAWLRGEDRRGWVQYKKAMYMLNEKDTEKLLDIFPNVSEQKEDEMQVSPLTEVTKRFTDYRISY